MNDENRERWLLGVGLAYPVVAFGVMLGCGGAMGPLAFRPLSVPLPAFLLAAGAVATRDGGRRFRWWPLALFAAWLAVVVWAQWSVYAAASAAV